VSHSFYWSAAHNSIFAAHDDLISTQDFCVENDSPPFLLYKLPPVIYRCGQCVVITDQRHIDTVLITCSIDSTGNKWQRSLFSTGTMTSLQAIKYSRGKLEVLDQLKLPHEFVYDNVSTCEEAFDCIKSMRVRGKPSIIIIVRAVTCTSFMDSPTQRRCLQVNYICSQLPTKMSPFSFKYSQSNQLSVNTHSTFQLITSAHY
jgi:hypothetical protein